MVLDGDIAGLVLPAHVYEGHPGAHVGQHIQALCCIEDPRDQLHPSQIQIDQPLDQEGPDLLLGRVWMGPERRTLGYWGSRCLEAAVGVVVVGIEVVVVEVAPPALPLAQLLMKSIYGSQQELDVGHQFFFEEVELGLFRVVII